MRISCICYFFTIDFFNGTTTPLLDTATTTSATSTDRAMYEITGARRATAYFKRTGIYGNDGTSTFRLQVSYSATSTDDSHWIDYNKLVDNVTNATANNPTRVLEAALTGTSTKLYSMDLVNDNIKYVRCIVEVETDGENGCKLLVQY